MHAEEYNKLTGIILRSSIEVHKHLGPGLLESVYELCLSEELRTAGLDVKRQIYLPVVYKELRLEKAFQIDMLIENCIVIELKSVEVLLPVHEAQLLSYLRLSDKKLGLLINFNVPVLKNGVRRKINGQL